MNTEKIKKLNTKYLAKEIIYKQEIKSTQELAKKIVKEVNNGCLIITDNQVCGKGTKGRVWTSNKNKNITMTIILNKSIEIEKLEGLTLKIAEGIKQSIKDLYDYNLNIKQPNDLLLNNKKICGILTESSIAQGKANYILIGIGFNVNEEKFTEDLKEIATSLKREFGRDFEREEIVIKILEKLEEIIEKQFQK